MTDHTHPEINQLSKDIGKVEGHIDGINKSIKRSEDVQAKIFDKLDNLASAKHECEQEDRIAHIDTLAHTAVDVSTDAYKMAKPLANGAKAAAETKRDYKQIFKQAAALVIAATVIAASSMAIRYFWVGMKVMADAEERTDEQ